ncbi:multidrug effflux MFS transporter [Photobacterium kasasachensis]|uniref:multidrug effflux MFS transporter n=1 Tax=Photobacterium kasasachensis TaxID=2910240 RepID=UPI003D0FAB1C
MSRMEAKTLKADLQQAKETKSDTTAGREFWLFVCLMAMTFSLSPFAIDMYLPALPDMATYFGTKIDAMEASVAIYLFGFALGQLVLGALADSIDKTKLLLGGLVVFTITSALVGVSETPVQLYLWRMAQAFSGGATVVVFALIQQKYGVKQSSQVISYIMAVVVVAPMVAPMIGSQVLAYLGWQWIFFGLAVYATITLLVMFAMKNTFAVNSTAARRNTGAEKSSTKPLKIGALVKGYNQIFSDPVILSYVLAGAASFAGLFAFISGSPFVYIEFFELSPQQYSWLVALNAIAMVSMNIVNARLLNHIDPTRKLIAGGKMLGAVAVYLLLVAWLQLSLAFVVVGVVMYVGCLGLTSANAIAGALANAGENAGLVSGINGVLQFGLGALASAVISMSSSVDALPMNATMAVCGLLTLGFVLFLKSKAQPSSQLS